MLKSHKCNTSFPGEIVPVLKAVALLTSEDFTNLPSLEPLVCEKLNYISCTTEEIFKAS